MVVSWRRERALGALALRKRAALGLDVFLLGHISLLF